MTRIYQTDHSEFNMIEEGNQSFITLRDDKVGIKAGDTLVLQDISEEDETQHSVRELSVKVDFTYYEGLKNGFVTCSLKSMAD